MTRTLQPQVFEFLGTFIAYNSPPGFLLFCRGAPPDFLPGIFAIVWRLHNELQ